MRKSWSEVTIIQSLYRVLCVLALSSSFGHFANSHNLNKRIQGCVFVSGGVEREQIKTLPISCNWKQFKRFPDKWEVPPEDF